MKRFLFCLLISLVCSCSKIEESDIPYAPVYLELDLRFGDKDLVGIYNHKSITKARTAGEKTGFSGVLVVCGIDNYGNAAYYAFDLSPRSQKEYHHRSRQCRKSDLPGMRN